MDKFEVGMVVKDRQSGIVGEIIEISEFIDLCRIQYNFRGRLCYTWAELANIEKVESEEA